MSDKDQIFQELQSYIVEQLGVEKEKVKPEAAFIEDLNADSLDLVEFAMGLEEKFGVTIADEELGKIKTVQDAVDAIVEKKENMGQDSNLRAVLFWGHAPNSQSRGKEMVEAMKKLDLLVVIDPYPSASAAMAAMVRAGLT